ncbi:unnamed protein product [Tilletia laevis]|uniref:AB hydrolase-1 domain-containing protein n=2 Tax=Tilletia TaxID=13289 RepID=A0A177VD77_9BASI|nr:hypothetical protein CF336_g3151 [Tilletia laevis]KAE8262691.1 hypothetical protein A4X03_0g2259 [Tilletia caries]KAE8205371.1 hypothetical protein CF335_g2321 [Tilletia laevis]CAD6888160.1 unnamed protein product [Tilletia caries]CAD6896877.1 unnamed protein product [Tilletia caries]
MPRVPPIYPPPGTSPIADAIRARRGARGLTPLDGTLLQSPAYASGWNALLGAVRSHTSVHLPPDVREIIILRIAARNRAAFEWIQHEIVARKEGGLKDDVLSAVRLTGVEPTPTRIQIADLTPPRGPLSELQAASVVFTDESTLDIRVQDSTFAHFRDLLLAEGRRRAAESDEIKDALKVPALFADRAITEATATAATYNMVSRFLVALDVDGRSLEPVPVPVPGTGSTKAAIPAPTMRNMIRTPDGQIISSLLHTATNVSAASAPTIICINSLMTDLTMWDHVLSHLRTVYNVITYDQRGHGLSSIPPTPCTLAQLADDTATVLSSYGIPQAHAVIGVSQGGATALAFLMRHPSRAQRIVACDTQAKSPEANIKAWDDRIQLVLNSTDGMATLAEQTLPRWYKALFPASSSGDGPGVTELELSYPRRAQILAHTTAMITQTPVHGFVAGARALQNYDLLTPAGCGDDSHVEGLLSVCKRTGTPVLLVAGANDGALPDTLRELAQSGLKVGANMRSEIIADAGHLPMMDQPGPWLAKVMPFLSNGVPQQ